MRFFTRIILIGVVLSVVLTGCGLFDSSDRNQVVASVNGEDILKGELMDMYDQEKAGYGITDEMENDSETEQHIIQLKSALLDYLINDRLISQKAQEAGYTVKDSHKKAAEESYSSLLDDIADNLQSQDKQAGILEDKDYNKLAEDTIKQELDDLSWSFDYYMNTIAKQMVIQEYYDYLVKDVKASDQDISSFYDETLALQIENPESTAYSEIQLYQPAQARIKYIFLGLSQDEQTEYEALVADEKYDEAQRYMEEHLDSKEQEAQELFQSIEEGRDFDSLIDDHTPDVWTGDFEDGYTISHNGQFDPQLEDVVFGMSAEDISEPVRTDNGYYIIKVYETIPEKEFSLKEKQEEIEEIVLMDLKGEAFDQILNEWLDASEITIYQERL